MLVAQAEVPGMFAEYGPLWLLVGCLLAGLAWIGMRLISQQQQVSDAQVASLNKGAESYTALANAASATAERCANMDAKVDVQTRFFQSALSSMRQYAESKGDDEMRRHVEAIDRQLHDDLSRVPG